VLGHVLCRTSFVWRLVLEVELLVCSLGSQINQQGHITSLGYLYTMDCRLFMLLEGKLLFFWMEENVEEQMSSRH